MKKSLFYMVIFIIITALTGVSVLADDSVSSINTQSTKIGLYPAYIISNNSQLWGYIDRTGKFAIKPQFDSASDFTQNGVAIVQKNFKDGIINRSGSFIVEPSYDYISDYNDGFAVASGENEYVYDDKGKLAFKYSGDLHEFHEGLALAKENKSNLYGFIDYTGNFKIKPQYKNGEDFKNGKAYVLTQDGKAYLIDKDGKIISEVSPEVSPEFSDEYNISFYDGMSIQKKDTKDTYFYGLYDKNGKEILSSKYCGIERINDSIFAASKQINGEGFHSILPKALFDKTGKRLTDFIFYDIKDAGDKLIVSDKYSTYYLNYDGSVVPGFPKIKGNDTIDTIDDLIKVTNYFDTEYYTMDGKIFWQPQRNFELANGIKITENTYSQDRYLITKYPQLEGYKKIDILNSINKHLKEAFMSQNANDLNYYRHKDYMDNQLFIDYSYELNKNLLTIYMKTYFNGFGPHGDTDFSSYNIDLTNGKFYVLGDLFKKGSDYKDVLELIIANYIKNNKLDYLDSKNPSIDNSIFFINKDNLQIFFNTYDIAAYASGPQTFDIPYSKISGLIDTKSPFWKSFDKNVQSGNPSYSGKPGDITIEMIKNIINRYEENITMSITVKDFSCVKPNLYPNSTLYKSQEGLVQRLSKQNVYESFESADVLKTRKINDTTIKAYVHEVISISKGDSETKKSEFYWIYTIKFSDQAGRYLLSDIKKWNR